MAEVYYILPNKVTKESQISNIQVAEIPNIQYPQYLCPGPRNDHLFGHFCCSESYYIKTTTDRYGHDYILRI